MKKLLIGVWCLFFGGLYASTLIRTNSMPWVASSGSYYYEYYDEIRFENNTPCAIQNYGTLYMWASAGQFSFIRNSVDWGSGSAVGGAIQNYGTLYLWNATFTSNSASSGGAIYNTGNLYLEDVTFIRNSGSAIYNESGTVDLKNCSFFNNDALFGSAIAGSGTININVTSGNRSIYDGVGGYNAEINCDVDDNAILDMHVYLEARQSIIVKTGDGLWKLGGGSAIDGHLIINEGTLELYPDATINKYGYWGNEELDFSLAATLLLNKGSLLIADTWVLDSGANIIFTGGEVTTDDLIITDDFDFEILWCEIGDALLSAITVSGIYTNLQGVADYMNSVWGRDIVGVSGNSIVALKSIPEPASVLMIAGTGILIALYRRFFNKL